LTNEHVEEVFRELLDIAAGKPVEETWRYLGVRE
jgi:hypothetical protein